VKKINPLILVGSFALLSTIPAAAQATRTWVSGVGDDANPCSRTAPCKTFAGAISKTSAGGEIDALDPAGWGAVTITKAITIDGGPNAGGILVSGSNGVVISAATTDVVILRNLNFVCTGTCVNGILINSAKAVHLQHLDIGFFTNHGISLTSPTTLYLDNSTIHESGQNGLNLAPSTAASASITDSYFEGNNNGIVANDFEKATVNNTRSVGNTVAGFVAQANASASTLNLINCEASFNTTAGVQSNGPGALATVRLSGTAFTSNGVAISTSGSASVLSFQNNPITGAGAPTGTLTVQ
jgi:hypothetical protein